MKKNTKETFKVQIAHLVSGKTRVLKGSCEKLPILEEDFLMWIEGGLSSYLIDFGKVLNIQLVDPGLGFNTLFQTPHGVYELRLLKAPRNPSGNVISLGSRRFERDARAKGAIVLYPELPEVHKLRTVADRKRMRSKIDALREAFRDLRDEN